ncbi:MAG: hypothetical protein AAF441_24530 [Pseudomonadota bacterium]
MAVSSAVQIMVFWVQNIAFLAFIASSIVLFFISKSGVIDLHLSSELVEYLVKVVPRLEDYQSQIHDENPRGFSRVALIAFLQVVAAIVCHLAQFLHYALCPGQETRALKEFETRVTSRWMSRGLAFEFSVLGILMLLYYLIFGGTGGRRMQLDLQSGEFWIMRDWLFAYALSALMTITWMTLKLRRKARSGEPHQTDE